MTTVWNFAFGSNLLPARVHARGIRPLRWEPAVLKGWHLTFDLVALSPMEPGFATLAPRAGVCVHGVCIEMRRGDFERLVRSEFASARLDPYGYQVVTVDVRSYAGERLRAETLIAPPTACVPGTLPSARYIDLLERGAAAQALVPDYVDFLRHHPRHRPGRLSPTVQRAVDTATAPLRLPAMWLARRGHPRCATALARAVGTRMARLAPVMPAPAAGRTVYVDGYTLEQLAARWPRFYRGPRP